MTLPRFLAAALLGTALLAPAFAQTEPTIDQIYQVANAGRMDEADRMIGQVLQKHPNSAKAHYVKAELAARESDASVARQELATAERLAPGLPFAKAESVSALRSEVSRARPVDHASTAVAPAPAPQRQVPMALVAILFALAAAGLYAFMRRRQAAATAMSPSWSPAYGPGSGPVVMDPAGSYPPGAYPPNAYPPGAYPPGAYPQAPQPGMGSTLGRGLATGLAMGAGMVAAEEIGHRMFDHHPQSSGASAASGASGVLPENERGLLDPGVNGDMGGQDFGIADPGSWDAGGSADLGGGDWDT
ncbi:hypothetical protein ACPWT1_12415 [Ramlibacter sp. MMS24-I3-19]|uniref:hypothetical protein n=1 Tax=Ramlibacter sp. MMS24-I3-19 TaxID=3416606 RepID=UPI003D044C9C